MNPQPPNPELAALPDLFLLNPKNRAFVEGMSSRIASSPVLRNRTILLLLVGATLLFLPIIILQPWMFLSLLPSIGDSAEAIVTGKWTDGGSESPLYVAYTFEAEGQTMTSQQSVHKDTYEQVSEGTKVQVIYVRGNPMISSLYSQLPQPVGWVCIGSSIIVGILLYSHKAIAIRRRAIRLVAQGQMLTGQVTNWQAMEIEDDETGRHFSLQLDYVFDTPDGRKRRDKIVKRIGVRDWRRTVSPPPDTPLAVLYVNDHLYEVL